MEKECFKCLRTLPLGEFYPHRQMADGHVNKCKTCNKRDVLEHRMANIDKIRAYDRGRGNRQSGEYLSEYRDKNPEKYNAHKAVSVAIKNGTLVRSNCEKCRSIKAHAHHDDYSRPLDVRWLCAAHHRQYHISLCE